MWLRSRERQIFTIIMLSCALLLGTLVNEHLSFADSGSLSSYMFRIGLHHGNTTLPFVRVAYLGTVQFVIPDFFGNSIPLLEDDAGAWQVHREAIRIEVGPFHDRALAEQTLARWPQNVGPAYLLREGEAFFVLGGLFFTVEQAWMSMPIVANAGIAGATVRGTMSLLSANAMSLNEAIALRDRLRASSLRSRLHFDGGWKVAVGSATDATLVNSLRDNLSAAAPEVAWDLLPTDFRRIEVVNQRGSLLFTYANLPSQPLRVEVVSGVDSVMSVEGRRHRGTFEFSLSNDHRFVVIGIMHVDDYIKGVVPREMPATWPLEALKAQAVVARTYAYANRNRHAGEAFDLCALSTHCQAYGGVEWERDSSNRAVDETAGMVAFFNGRPASTFYHSDSGGHTENVENVWTSTIPYLVGVPDPYGAMAGSTHSSWQTELSQAEMQHIVRFNGGDVGTILAVRVRGRYPSGRVSELVITGTRGSVTYTKQQPRLLNGSSGLFALRSTMYSVTSNATPVVVANGQGTVMLPSLQGVQVATANGIQAVPTTEQHILAGGSGTVAVNAAPTSFVFRGSGWGHGIGLSQWGARGMAEAGHTYTEILLHYYRGIMLVPVAR